MEDRIRGAVELERLHAEPGAQGEIEGGGRLHPLSVEQELGIAVEYEKIRAHLLGELGRGEMVLDVGEADARRDAVGARAGGEQRRLGNAPARWRYSFIYPAS
jgi:hypothetical protein